jgi:hypothetical protein
MKRIGFMLVALGILALVYRGISYSRERVVLDVGTIKTTRSEQHNIPIPRPVGCIVILSGLMALVVPRPRTE